MRESNTADTVADVTRQLHDDGFPCLVFGGWAEEAFGLCPARRHADIDLLLPARSFDALDSLLLAGREEFEELPLKRFAHKRAFLFNGVVVEVMLVQQSNGTAYTMFWGDLRFDWSMPLAEPCVLGRQRLLAASPANLRRFRTNYRSTQPWRWKDPASLVSRCG